VLKQVNTGRKAEDVAQEHSVSKHSYAWKAKYVGLEVNGGDSYGRKECNEERPHSSPATKRLSSPQTLGRRAIEKDVGCVRLALC
jgi:hypothetical protein